MRSSIGKKALMAISGLILLGFVILHLLGNLLIYRGPEAINAYARKLRDLGPLLWAVRLFLLASVIVHVWMSILVSRENARARPIPYRLKRSLATSSAARTMLLSGLLVAAYLVYHLLHFTFRLAHPELSRATDGLGHVDVYAMMVLSFQRIGISLAYVVGMALLCLHLSHGTASSFQTLGITGERSLPVVTRISRLSALLLFLGYISIPVAVLLGVLTLPGSG
jgi:succinate dehydrogenase / fumarate reductase cytochrome b subunit